MGLGRGVGAVKISREEARVLAAVLRYFLRAMDSKENRELFTEQNRITIARLQAQLLLYGTEPVKR